MLNQVSLFTENNEGGLFKITTILAKANINIYTMLANDSAESFFSFLISMLFLLQKRLNFQCAAKGRAFHFL